MKGEPIKIDELPIDGLENLRQQLRQVVDAKQKGAQVLASTASAFDQSRSAIQDLSKLNDGTLFNWLQSQSSNCDVCF